MTDNEQDPRTAHFLAAGRDLAVAVNRKEISRDAAATAVAGILVACGIPSVMVVREMFEIIRRWKDMTPDTRTPDA